MRKTTTGFEQRWSLWLSALSGITLIISGGLAVWIQFGASGIQHTSRKDHRESLLSHYNDIAHGGFIAVLVVLAALLIRSILQTSAPEATANARRPWPSAVAGFIRQHPVVAIILTTYVVLMLESSWFYKEILTWYDDIYSDHLLNNFSLRESFIKETMGRNDFRFYPLSHQDLHILSWVTPYTKIWSLVSAFELIATIILGCKLIERVNNNRTSPSTHADGNLAVPVYQCIGLQLFPIYLQRVISDISACFVRLSLQPLPGFRPAAQRTTRLALRTVHPFFKDTAVLLAVIPAATTIVAGSLGTMPNSPTMAVDQAPRLDEGLRPGTGNPQPGTFLSGSICDAQRTSQPCR